MGEGRGEGRGLCPHLLKTFLKKGFKNSKNFQDKRVKSPTVDGANKAYPRLFSYESFCSRSSLWVRHHPAWESFADRRQNSSREPLGTTTLPAPQSKFLHSRMESGYKDWQFAEQKARISRTAGVRQPKFSAEKNDQKPYHDENVIWLLI